MLQESSDRTNTDEWFPGKADVGENITSENRHKKGLVVTACHRHHFGHKRMKIGRKFKDFLVPSGARRKKGNLTQVTIKEIYIC